MLTQEGVQQMVKSEVYSFISGLLVGVMLTMGVVYFYVSSVWSEYVSRFL
jgi:hypothetical protein